MSLKYFGNALIVFGSVMTIFTACKKDNHTGTHTPAYHIHESEKLVMPAAIALPENLPAGNSRVVTYYAEGVQKYRAQLKAGTTNVFEWVFVAPEALLFDNLNRVVGTHSAGPTWQLYGNTDSVFAQHFSPVRAVASPDASSIDWLLLKTKDGKTPTGVFAGVDYIQRIATRGGKAPLTAPLSASDTINVKYTAVYRFAKKNP